MLRKIIFIFWTLFILILMCCSNDLETVSHDAISSINIEDYFPVSDLERYYINYEEDGSEGFLVNYVKLESEESLSSIYSIFEYSGPGFPIIRTYEVNEHHITEIYEESMDDSKELIENGKEWDETILMNEPEWDEGDAADSRRYISKIDLDVTVPAGDFSEVIEVIDIVEKAGE